MQKLKGKKALITGGARGIGKVIAKAFVDEGAQVLICSRSEEELKQTAKALSTPDHEVLYTTADVSSFESCQKLFSYAAEKLGGIDILVNNAGIYGPIGPVETNPPKDWQQTININLLGTLYCIQLALKTMKANKKGKIINLAGAGVGSKKPLTRFSAYYASKAAVAAFTEVVASETLADNIQINAISPGAVNTFFTDYLLSQGKEKAGSMYDQALKQKESGGDPPELGAELCVFLASDESSNVTGKLLSAKWDKQEILKNLTSEDQSKYTLRRIDGELFSEK